eukprot:3769186-Amphidinium_carterae.1
MNARAELLQIQLQAEQKCQNSSTVGEVADTIGENIMTREQEYGKRLQSESLRANALAVRCSLGGQQDEDVSDRHGRRPT